MKNERILRVKNNYDKDQTSKKEINQMTSSLLKDLKMEYCVSEYVSNIMTAVYPLIFSKDQLGAKKCQTRSTRRKDNEKIRNISC
jgi:hypothetical protein